MFRKTGLLLCCTAFFFLVGGHWAVLQSVAWAKMIVNYARADSLPHAVAKTFDGNHPCEMCKEISKSKKTEETPVTLKSDKKIESLAGSVMSSVFAPDANSGRALRDFMPGAGRADSPPVPPPRFFSI